MPYQAIRSAHGQLKQLGLHRCERVDPPPPPPQSSPSFSSEAHGLRVNSPAAPAATAAVTEATPWELFASESLRVAAQKAADGLRNDGAAVVDDVLGRRLSAAVSAALRRYADESRDVFKPGELDQTGRSDEGTRGDLIAWLAGDEGVEWKRRHNNNTPDDDDDDDEDDEEGPLLGSPPPGIHAGAVAQLMRSCLLDHLSAALPPGSLAPPDGYVSNAMLSVYAPGAPGFIPHTDNCGPSDPRRVTAVYYPNVGEWSDADGGQLVLWPRDGEGRKDGGGGGDNAVLLKGGGEKGEGEEEGEGGTRRRRRRRRREIKPVGDRLVLFYSNEVEHEVLPVSVDAARERLALSFWYLKPTTFDPGVMMR